jgi:hypothetical protein
MAAKEFHGTEVVPFLELFVLARAQPPPAAPLSVGIL